MGESALRALFKNNERNFNYLLLITFLFVLFSHPFLKYPYDMWAHLIRIDDVNSFNKIISLRKLWYLFWAEIFHFSSINDIFIRAQIIHVVQTTISLFSVFIFSRVVIRNFFKDINATSLNYLSYWSVIVWLTIYATFSMYTHQVWVMWYSINYQVALAFFWYITALTLIFILEQKKWLVKLFYLLQIFLFSYIIFMIHPMELMYYFIYLSLLVLIYFGVIIRFVKKKYIIVVPVLLAIIALAYYFFQNFYQYNDKVPAFVTYLSRGQHALLYEMILLNGSQLVNGMNRAFASVNELMVLVFFVGLIFIVVEVRKQLSNREDKANLHLFLFIVLSSLLVVIPLFQFSAGIASVISSIGVVNRFYYSSSLFVLLPIGIYYFWSAYGEKVSISKINLSVISILILTLLFSRFYSESHNYYKNVKSLVYSFDESKVGFNLSPNNIKNIGILLKAYEKNIPVEGKNVIYFARPDISLILKYVFKRNVYMDFSWNGKPYRRNLKQFEAYSQSKKVLDTKIPIVFKTPDGFPEYVPYK